MRNTKQNKMSMSTFVSLTIGLMMPAVLCGCAPQSTSKINKWKYYQNIKVTITDIKTSIRRGDAGVKVQWTAKGSLVKEVGIPNDPSEDNRDSREALRNNAYVSMGLSVISDPFNATGLNPTIFSNGEDVALKNFALDLKKTGRSSVEGTMGTTDYHNVDTIREITIPGITISLPVYRKVTITKEGSSTFSAHPNIIQVNGGKVMIKSIDLDGSSPNQKQIKIAVQMQRDNGTCYPIGLDSCSLVDSNNRERLQGGTVLPDPKDWSIQELYFEKPEDVEKLTLKVYRVRYGIPGEWVIRLKKSPV